MIFESDMLKKIAAGQKTEMRRPVTGEENCPYRKGRTYGIQRERGRRAAARIEITSTSTQMLDALSELDARHEGFATSDEFFATWEATYGPRRDRLVWVARFVLVDEPALYLARPVPGRRSDYTRNRGQAIDDLPVVDPEQLVDNSDLNFMLLGRYVGWEPEDVLADSPQFNTTDDIKRLRRALGQRGLDGLPQPGQAQLDRTLAYMVKEGRSVRDVARAMDCSVGHAYKLMRANARREEAA